MEYNYNAQDKKMLTIVRAIMYWRPELVSLHDTPFLIITNHQALEYYSTKRHLNARQSG